MDSQNTEQWVVCVKGLIGLDLGPCDWFKGVVVNVH